MIGYGEFWTQILPNPNKYENTGIALFKVTPTEADFHMYYSIILSDKIHTEGKILYLFHIVIIYFIIIILFQILNLKNSVFFSLCLSHEYWVTDVSFP